MSMRIRDTPLEGMKILAPEVHRDARGFFLESWNSQMSSQLDGDQALVQINHSRSISGVLRGIHFQQPDPQAKLIRVVRGRIWDVAVDLRQQSPTFGKWFGLYLDDVDLEMLWIPEGFGHGFLTISEEADIVYGCSSEYSPAGDKAVAWNDDELAIDWPVNEVDSLTLSDRDRNAPALAKADIFP